MLSPPGCLALPPSGIYERPIKSIFFSNYNDDRAKNHRIYAAEILWRFYEKMGQPAPPLALAEQYPRAEMVSWLPIIGVGVVLLSATLGGIFNRFALTCKEKSSQVTLARGPLRKTWLL